MPLSEGKTGMFSSRPAILQREKPGSQREKLMFPYWRQDGNVVL
jgi:hypothetical protein